MVLSISCWPMVTHLLTMACPSRSVCVTSAPLLPSVHLTLPPSLPAPPACPAQQPRSPARRPQRQSRCLLPAPLGPLLLLLSALRLLHPPLLSLLVKPRFRFSCGRGSHLLRSAPSQLKPSWIRPTKTSCLSCLSSWPRWMGPSCRSHPWCSLSLWTTSLLLLRPRLLLLPPNPQPGCAPSRLLLLGSPSSQTHLPPSQLTADELTAATLRTVAKHTSRARISKLILGPTPVRWLIIAPPDPLLVSASDMQSFVCASFQVRNPLCVIGLNATRGLPGLTSCPDTVALTRVKRGSHAMSVWNASCVVTTWPSMLGATLWLLGRIGCPTAAPNPAAPRTVVLGTIICSSSHRVNQSDLCSWYYMLSNGQSCIWPKFYWVALLQCTGFHKDSSFVFRFYLLSYFLPASLSYCLCDIQVVYLIYVDSLYSHVPLNYIFLTPFVDLHDIPVTLSAVSTFAAYLPDLYLLGWYILPADSSLLCALS